ncbi:alpha/beta fold hydrolase (macronuclear) [Tetrahymena thermophila SB210]|uniref:Alpha/beta fold hydrolase n=1 Tax=Tetrahymena thermophila (strain SB210) TaxID=312017 RepID=I7LZE9_TETTS|nr:alpha/beta fold hydrolase [Tetrahymena thermophila SB210]EAR83757.2 alpha/beta fold hydrolase [Tetrahymena thermophila SB210]|eukprot:XP_001031420.2 alpha/beta fold hydrolase [Tetrahymena thermophila SB210]
MELFFSESDISESDINQIIRPKRLMYGQHDLGPNVKNIKGTMVMRKDFQVVNSRQEKLQCSLFFPKNEQQSNLLVIYLHGNSGCRLEANPVVANLAPLGYHVCSYDSSGCGLSEGKYVTLGINEKDDLHAIINKMKQQFGYTHFILWGRSMGAVTSLMYCLSIQDQYVVAGGQLNNLNGVVGLVIDSAFSNFANLTKEIASKKISSLLVSIGIKHLRNKLKKALNGMDLFEIDLSYDIKKLKLPAIFAYSENDTVILPKHTHILYDNYGGPKQKAQFQGDHNCMRDSNYFNSIISFINNYLKHYKCSENHFHSIENQAAFSQTNPSLRLNTLNSSLKLNSTGLYNSNQFLINNTLNTPLKIDLQTPRENLVSNAKSHTISDFYKKKSSQQEKNTNQKQLFQQYVNQQSQKPDQRLNLGIPNNLVSQSVDSSIYFPITNKSNQKYVIQNPQNLNTISDNNENYFSLQQQQLQQQQQQQPSQINVMNPQANQDLRLLQVNNYINPSISQNTTYLQKGYQQNQVFVNPQYVQATPSQTQPQPQPLLLSNMNLPNYNQSRDSYHKVQYQQVRQSQMTSPSNNFANTVSQLKITNNQNLNNNQIKRSQSSSSISFPVQKIDNNYLNNLKRMSFITANNSQNNTVINSIYSQPANFKSSFNVQYSNHIKLK